MSDTYSLDVVIAALTGSTQDWSETIESDISSLGEIFSAQVKLPASTSDETLKLNLLTDPKLLIVAGGDGCSFKLDSTGTDAIKCNPVAVVSDEDEGIDIDEILLSNGDTEEQTVNIYAFE
jgi:hypothetical protein